MDCRRESPKAKAIGWIFLYSDAIKLARDVEDITQSFNAKFRQTERSLEDIEHKINFIKYVLGACGIEELYFGRFPVLFTTVNN